MASTPHSNILLLVIGTCSVFLDDLAVEGNNQPPSDSTIEGQGSSFFFYQNPEYPRDCSEVRDSCPSSLSSGVYLIKPDDYKEPFEVYCDNGIDSGGWTVILRRFDGSVDFSRQWSDYKKGFGFLSTEFWLGNDKLSYLTNQALYELRIDITLGNGTVCDVKYGAFRVSDEWSGYKLSTLGTFESDADGKKVANVILPTDVTQRMFLQTSQIVPTCTMPVKHKIAFTTSAQQDGTIHPLKYSVTCLSMAASGQYFNVV